MTLTTAASEEQQAGGLQQKIESYSKALGVLIVGAYASGYITVSLYYAALGMPLTNPLRPQVVAAGFVSILMTACPVWASYQIFRWPELKAAVETLDYLTTVLKGMSKLYIFSVFLSVPAQVFFVLSSYKPRTWNTAAYIALYALDAALLATITGTPRIADLLKRKPLATLD